MNAPVTRRALLGATAAVGAMSLPALAEAGNPATPFAAPDAELFRLLDLYPAALAAMKEAGDRCEVLWDAFVAQEPERPAALRVRFGDDLRCGDAAEKAPDGRWVALYDLHAVAKLRGLPPPTRCEETYTPHPEIPGDQIVRLERVPDERRIARRAEVLAAHDDWWAECDAIKERLGIPAADEADERATDALRDLQDAILATEPATFAGLAAKARWTSQCRLGAIFAADWHRRIVEDVVALAERGGAAA